MSKEQAICNSIIEPAFLNRCEETEGAILHVLETVTGDLQ